MGVVFFGGTRPRMGCAASHVHLRVSTGCRPRSTPRHAEQPAEASEAQDASSPQTPSPCPRGGHAGRAGQERGADDRFLRSMGGTRTGPAGGRRSPECVPGSWLARGTVSGAHRGGGSVPFSTGGARHLPSPMPGGTRGPGVGRIRWRRCATLKRRRTPPGPPDETDVRTSRILYADVHPYTRSRIKIVHEKGTNLERACLSEER